tara:strand:+ start:4008 stop:4292 length:285 start_codon:yes stop_codon:yes gene_type:complete
MEDQTPYIEIDGVQISVDELPEEGQAIFGRLQRLNQKKANQVLDLEETNAAINFFSTRIVEIVNHDEESNSSNSDEVPVGEVAMPEIETDSDES